MAVTRDSQGVLRLGGAALDRVAAELGTPTYVYDLDGMAAEARALRAGFEGEPHLVAYAVKANSAGPVLRALAAAGCGADVVSGAELLVALGSGISPEHIVYSGVAKTDEEIDRALGAGERGIGAVQLESLEEIARVQARARAAGRKARVSVRINPGVDQTHATHAHIATGHDAAKFGVRREDAADAVRLIAAASDLELVGMATHVGSQFLSLEPHLEGARVLFELVRSLREAGRLRGLAYLDVGGGFGVDYAGDGAGRGPPAPADVVRAVRAEQRARGLGDLALYVEPGRVLVASHGALLAKVIQSKVTPAARWLMIDAGMNDLIRPALYQARHRIVPLRLEAGRELSARPSSAAANWRVVGPVCESSDDFGEHRLPEPPPDAVAILDAGAYGYVMASRYNGRPLPVEVFVRGGALVGATERAPTDAWVAERLRAGSR